MTIVEQYAMWTFAGNTIRIIFLYNYGNNNNNNSL